MCTVTFIPGRDQIFLSANRDEKPGRSPALIPAGHRHSSGDMIYPIDPLGRGTWFAVHESGNAVVFLNGAWVGHETNGPYRKSRGLILLDLANAKHPSAIFETIALEGIEPFTAIIRDQGKLIECRWDAHRKYSSRLDPAQPHIWSSATLYSPEVAARRASEFRKWLQTNPRPRQDEVLQFHRTSAESNRQDNLLKNRDGQVSTVSITSAAIGEDQAILRYLDLGKDRSYEMCWPLANTIPIKK